MFSWFGSKAEFGGLCQADVIHPMLNGNTKEATAGQQGGSGNIVLL